MFKRISVFGAGNGGCTAAADLTLRGHEVTLFELPEFKQNLDPIRDRGGIQVTGVIEGFAPIKKVTTDVKEAVEAVDLIMVIAPSYSHKSFASICGKHLKEGQSIILNPGSSGGALEFNKTLEEMGVRNKVKIAETSTLPYAARIVGPAQVRVMLQVKWLLFAAFPAKDTESLLSEFRKLYPAAEVGEDVFDTSLNNGNPVTHTAGSILNAGRIEHSKGNFHLYREGITPSTARVIEGVDNERLSICELLELRKITTPERLYRSGYTNTKNSFLDAYISSNVFQDPDPSEKAPTSLQHRYIVEDIGDGLVFWVSIGDQFGIPTPTMKSLIHLASVMNQTDYFEKGNRTMKKLGLSGMSLKGLKKYLQTGTTH